MKGLSKLIANNEEEALNFLFEGETNRSISSHVLNKQSSRSHCIFTIFLEMRSRVESEEKIIRSKLHFCDLAVRTIIIIITTRGLNVLVRLLLKEQH